MPVILKIEHADGQKTAVWEITEDEFKLLELAKLNKTDSIRLSLISNHGRRLEWLATRALLTQFYTAIPSIDYKENGKPFFNDLKDKISISHSGTMVAIALHSTQTPGIDIEMLNQRIFKIATRFLGDEEKVAIGNNPTVEELTIVWGAKEVLFKIYEHGEVSFKEDLLVKPFKISPRGSFSGIIKKDDKNAHIPMEYMQIGNYMMVHTNYSYSDFEKNSEL